MRLPGLSAFRGRSGSDWLRDAVAGVTLAAYLLPAGIGYASLAGLPPESGLYACLCAGLLFWLFCGSRYTAVSVTTAISLLVGVTLSGLSGGDPARHAALASAAALLTGLLALAAWAIRAGSLVHFVSESVMGGFKCGVGLTLVAAQLPKLLGFKGPPGDFWERAADLFARLPETHGPSLLLGTSALLLLLLGKALFPVRPVALAVVVAGIAAVPLFGLEVRGVKTLGDVPQGLPVPGLPSIRASDVNTLLPLALACFLLGAVETAAVGRLFARKHGQHVDSNQDFLALGMSNLASGLGRGFPVSGGMSQSLVNEAAGARSSASGLIAALILGAAALFLTGRLRDLPQPVLAAVVIAAVTGLLKIGELRRLWRLSRGEFTVAVATLLGVLGSGLLRGVLIGALLSLLLLIRRASRPRTAELGRIPGTDHFGPSGSERPEDAFVFRSEAALMYFNADYVRERFWAALDARGPGIRVAVFSLGTSPAIDLAGAELLDELHHDLAARGITFRVADAPEAVAEMLRRTGFDLKVPVLIGQPAASAIERGRASVRAS
jgi:SulP family sulfate permease